MASSDIFSTPSRRRLCNCTTSSACWRREKPPNRLVPMAFGESRRNERWAVTASRAVPASPACRRMAVARAESMAASTSSTLKNFRASASNCDGEKDGRPKTSRWVGRITRPGRSLSGRSLSERSISERSLSERSMSTKVIMTESYGAGVCAVVHHEDLAEVGPVRAQQVQPVGLRLGQRLLVAEDDAGGIVLDPAKRNETPALGLLPASGSVSRNAKGLGITVDGRLRILSQNGCLAPVLEGRCRAGIDVFGVPVPG